MDSCTDYWDGSDICPLNDKDRYDSRSTFATILNYPFSIYLGRKY